MSALINGTKAALLLLCGAGFYATWYLLFNNGTRDLMASMRDVQPRPLLLPGTEEPLKETYTGVAMIDYQLTVLDIFFWEMLDGSRPDASLFSYYFAGQVFSGWSLLMIESMRNANLWRVVSFIAIWGFLLQNLAYAVIIPIFLIVHLSTSPMVFSTIAADYAVNPIDALSIPIAMFLGYVVPTVLMSLPAPSVLEHTEKQNLMAFWQEFPIWVSVWQPILAFLLRSITDGRSTARDPTPYPKASMKTLRSIYIILLVAAGANQISTLSMVAASHFFPGIFATEYNGIFNFSKVFLPQAITPSTKMSSIGDGALQLLQYDETIGSSSIALWATVLLVQGHRNRRKSLDYANLFFHGLVAIVLTGPLGYAVACIWARDELAHEVNLLEEKKSQ